MRDNTAGVLSGPEKKTVLETSGPSSDGECLERKRIRGQTNVRPRAILALAKSTHGRIRHQAREDPWAAGKACEGKDVSAGEFRGWTESFRQPGGPALGPIALRPTLTDGLPLSRYPDTQRLLNTSAPIGQLPPQPGDGIQARGGGHVQTPGPVAPIENVWSRLPGLSNKLFPF
jgi:hypothetical protein